MSPRKSSPEFSAASFPVSPIISTETESCLKAREAMADRPYLNERVQETVKNLSDEELALMLDQPRHHTRFALGLARKEMARRRRNKRNQKTVPPAGVPVALAKSGDCWIDVWRETSFKGESIRIHGPAAYPTLKIGDEDWADRIRSLRVGPHAFVLAYRDKDFKASMVAFGPNQEVPNLSEFKFKDEIDSIRIIDSMKIFDRPQVTGDR
jgi:hypothetical protein